MSTTAAITGKGTKIGYAADVASLTTPTFFAEVTDVKVPEISVARIDATNYESPNNAMEYISAVWQDAAEFAIEITYTATQAATIYGLVGVTKGFKILIGGVASVTLLGHISKLGLESPNKDKIKQTITIAPHGALTFSAT